MSAKAIYRQGFYRTIRLQRQKLLKKLKLWLAELYCINPTHRHLSRLSRIIVKLEWSCVSYLEKELQS